MRLLERITSLLRPGQPGSAAARKSDAAARQWPGFTSEAPWFDRDDALEVLAQRSADGRYTAEEADLLRKWITDGYVILEGAVSGDTIERMCADVMSLWEAPAPLADLQIEEVRLAEDQPHGMSHAEVLKIPLERRRQMRDNERWRIHGFHRFSDNARAIFRDERVRAACSLIFDRDAEPHYSINFIYGSRQELHQDTAVFHVYPPNYLIGAWLACEDVSADAGPLVYLPGSHRTPFFAGFDNYPQTNLRTCNDDQRIAYNANLEKQAEGFEQRRFLAKKGDVLLWHGMLIHGGDRINTPGLTRKSHVTHYIPIGMDRTSEVVGPFNWG